MTPRRKGLYVTAGALAAAVLIYVFALPRDARRAGSVSATAEYGAAQDRYRDGATAPEGRAESTASGPTASAGRHKPDRWAERLHESTDYFAFATEAGQAALAGDARAAYHLAPLLAKCTLIARNSDGPDRRVAYENYLTRYFPHMPGWAREEQLEKVSRCARFSSGDPFAGLPPREGGYPIAYWRELAVSGGDPVARVEQAVGEIAQLGEETDGARRAATFEKARATAREAIAAGDPAAMFKVGLMLADSRIGADPEQGLAWSVLACQSGYDCSARNPANVYSRCARSGACPADADWQYYLRQSLGEAGYARAFARAQELGDLLTRGHWEQIDESLRLAQP